MISFSFSFGIVIAELIDNAFDEVCSFLLSFEWLWFFLKYAYVISEVTLSIFQLKKKKKEKDHPI